MRRSKMRFKVPKKNLLTFYINLCYKNESYIIYIILAYRNDVITVYDCVSLCLEKEKTMTQPNEQPSYAKQKFFSVYDSARQTYLAPMVFSTVEEAERYVDELLKNNSNSQFAIYKKDFKLCELGTFEPSTGKIKGCFIEKQIDFDTIVGKYDGHKK